MAFHTILVQKHFFVLWLVFNFLLGLFSSLFQTMLQGREVKRLSRQKVLFVCVALLELCGLYHKYKNDVAEIQIVCVAEILRLGIQVGPGSAWISSTL